MEPSRLSDLRHADALARRVVILPGPLDWARERILAALPEQARGDALWIGEEASGVIPGAAPQQFRQHLGSERAALVYDAQRGFHPDAFAAWLGVLRGGGVLYLLLPQGDWPVPDDPALERLACWPLGPKDVGQRFFWRFRKQIAAHPALRVVNPGGREPLPLPLPQRTQAWELNAGQQEVVAAVERVALGHARRPLVLTADRGRGKSTALGAAVARLLSLGKQVLLCAPSIWSVQALFEQLQRELPAGRRDDHSFSWRSGRLQLREPSAQLQAPQDCDLLVIDEAAALGLEVLQRLLASHNRIVFSTTVHGYEGSGRGFLLRFRELVREAMPGMRGLELKEPVRWAADDPLEAWVNEMLLLEAEPKPANLAAKPHLEWLSQDELARDEGLLKQVFGLLVAAHYQTRPSDLQRLLDAPAQHLLVARDADVILGVVLLGAEGGFDEALAGRICRGERRPRGHLLLQSLAQHGGWCEAPRQRALRVMRIAVQAPVRGRGIGSALLAEAESWAREQGYGLIGTSFGAEAGLLSFWQRAGYRLARLGHGVDPASGAHAAQLLKGLDSPGRDFVDRVHAAFRRDLPWRLQRELSALPLAMLGALLPGKPWTELHPDRRDLAAVDAFAFGRRGYLDAFPALWRWVLEKARQDPDRIAPEVLQEVLLGEAGGSWNRARERNLRALIRDALDVVETVDQR
jgi:tRNA(Met) cytidine acetyltransferase